MERRPCVLCVSRSHLLYRSEEDEDLPGFTRIYLGFTTEHVYEIYCMPSYRSVSPASNSANFGEGFLVIIVFSSPLLPDSYREDAFDRTSIFDEEYGDRPFHPKYYYNNTTPFARVGLFWTISTRRWFANNLSSKWRRVEWPRRASASFRSWKI